MLTDILTIGGYVVTGFVSFSIAKSKQKNERQKFYEDKITQMFEEQAVEIRDLRLQVVELTNENIELRKQIMEWRAQ